MDFEKNKIVLALLLINQGEPLNNSYKLVRIFEHKFRINPIFILKELRDKGYVNYKLVNGVYYYELTSKGRDLVSQEYNIALKFLMNEYPKEADIIMSLFNYFSTTSP
jgi:predicted transcriptional regulator